MVSKAERDKKWFIGIAILVIIGIYLSTQGKMEQEAPTGILTETSWQETYSRAAEQEFNDYNRYLSNTLYYDYNNEIISRVAEDIALSSNTPKEASERTLGFVYTNIDYVFGESDAACFDGTAPSILTSGKGQCDTQSIVTIAILRKIGIVAKPVGGCVFPSGRCAGAFSVLEAISGPVLTEQAFFPDQDTFSRGISSREGGLHAYVTAWLPEEGWLPLEPTKGKIADTKCWNYHVELYPTDSQKIDICVSKNWAYASACIDNDLQGLNQQGLGLATEVFP